MNLDGDTSTLSVEYNSNGFYLPESGESFVVDSVSGSTMTMYDDEGSVYTLQRQ